jgi:hypothetical protein
MVAASMMYMFFRLRAEDIGVRNEAFRATVHGAAERIKSLLGGIKLKQCYTHNKHSSKIFLTLSTGRASTAFVTF